MFAQNLRPGAAERVAWGTRACAPQVIANGTVVESQHPRAGRMRQPSPAARFERTPARVGGPAPGLGEHSGEILAELGLGPGEIGALRAAGVVA